MPNIESRRILACLVVAMAMGGCARPSPTKADPPATVTGKKPESEVARVTLTPEAEARIGVALVSAELRPSVRTRTLGGDVQPSSGRSLSVVAPVAGRIDLAAAGLRVGQHVKQGDALVGLTPVAGVDRDLRATAERSTQNAESRLSTMEARVMRAETLLDGGAGSARAAEEARLERDTARSELAAAKARSAMLARAPLEADVSVTLRAPEDGVVRVVSALPKTFVAAGSPLFELVGTGALWVRVGIFSGDLRSIRLDAGARVRALTAPASEADAEALPVLGPPTGDPTAATFDLYYALPKDTPFQPGERIAISVVYAGDTTSIALPSSSVIRDVSGTAWVYEAVADHAFERRRVEVERVEGTTARLSRGLRPGAKIVSAGTPELFGFEFGTGK